MTDNHGYKPPLGMKNPTLQSILASARIRARGANPMLEAARDMVLEVEGGVRLLGSYSPQTAPEPKGLAIMLHGWEGSVDSTYMLLTGRSLYQAGYHLFRLNYRDHGKSHHLNRGIFRAFLLEEVYQAVRQAAEMHPDMNAFLVGFSLGGNFALRVARVCVQRPIANLRHVAVISPLLDPDKATTAIDEHPLFRRYFKNKWCRSLMTKQALFPDIYNFDDVIALPTIRSMTDALVSYLGKYTTPEQYFKSYTITGDYLAGVDLPTTLITAQDDPVIPFGDFGALELSPSMKLIAPAHGGHSGFINDWSLQSWYQDRVVDILDAAGS